MALILISEPHLSTRRAIARMVARLGHEPVLARVPAPEHFVDFDAYILDIAGSIGLTLALAAREAREPEDPLPIIGIGVEPPAKMFKTLGIEPSVFLLKPFTAEQLCDAVEHVLARPP